MRRPAFALIGALLLLPTSVTFAAISTSSISVSGQPFLGIVDGNGDGPGPGDCKFTGMADSAGGLHVMTTQDTHTPLQACSGGYTGNVDPGFATDTSVAGMFTMASIVGGIANPPFMFDGSFLPQGGASAGGAAATGPRTVTKVTFTDGLGNIVGAGSICNSVARVTLSNGAPIGVGIDMNTPGFLHVSNIPFEKANLSGVVFKDVFIPKTDGTVTFALDNSPTNILLQILLTSTCPGGAPALSEWKLIFLAVGLLAGGVWMLGRRRAFYEGLPLP